MTEIKLGDTVKCIYTGYSGIALSKVEFINGCAQYTVVAKSKNNKEQPEEIAIDSQSLKVIKKGPGHDNDDSDNDDSDDDDNGGPMRKAPTQRGY